MDKIISALTKNMKLVIILIFLLLLILGIIFIADIDETTTTINKEGGWTNKIKRFF